MPRDGSALGSIRGTGLGSGDAGGGGAGAGDGCGGVSGCSWTAGAGANDGSLSSPSSRGGVGGSALVGAGRGAGAGGAAGGPSGGDPRREAVNTPPTPRSRDAAASTTARAAAEIARRTRVTRG
ncbi:MAG TPA: hypothetical protein VFR81_19210, partial [Longimicrobium sp.]|nr:hypothetical protein [Longimicrobium sp.]